MVDLVDQDDAAQSARLGMFHHAFGAVADAGIRVDHDGDGFHGGQRGQGRAAEIRITRRVDQVEAHRCLSGRLVFQTGDGAVQRMPATLFHGVVVGQGIAAFNAAGHLQGTACVQQGFEQGGLAGTGMAYEGHVAQLCCRVRHEAIPPMWME